MQADTQSLSNQNTPINLTDDLLVKDASGKLKRWQSSRQTSQSKANISQFGPASTDPSITQAPANDSFNFVNKDQKSEARADSGFHPEDQEQLQQIGMHMPGDDSPRYSIDKICGRIIEKHDLQLDEPNKKAFISLIFDFFRGFKKVPVVRQILGEKILSGNKKIDASMVDSIMSVVKALKIKIDAAGGLVVRAEDLLPNKPARKGPAMDFIQEPRPSFIGSTFNEKKTDENEQKQIAEALKQIAGKVEEEEKKKEDKTIVVPAPVDKVKSELNPKEPEKKAEPVKSAEMPEENHVMLPRVRRVTVQQAKPPVTDVISKSQAAGAAKKFSLSGPVEELKDMTIGNFRYLGQSVDERVDKLLDKFDVLQQDSFTKRAQGIAAWRQSPVYQNYLELGRESMVQNKKVEDLIAEYKASGKAVLELNEFAAISDLNKQLRF